MRRCNIETTILSDLEAVKDWRNHRSWIAFQKRYEPLLELCCASLKLRGQDAEEVRQNTWITVANEMRVFIYDPKGTFRRWLWTVCYHEALKHFKERKRHPHVPLEDWGAGLQRGAEIGDLDDSTPGADPGYLSDSFDDSTPFTRLLRETERIQAAVRQRVEPQTWDVFWLVGVAF